MIRVWTSVQQSTRQVKVVQLDKRKLIRQPRELTACFTQEFFGDYPGFEVFAADRVNEMVKEMVRGRLTQSLSEVSALMCPMV